MTIEQDLQTTIDQMVQPAKGILAADESLPTIAKRFAPVGVDPTEENRRVYRTLLFSTPGVDEYLCGVIEFEETLQQQDDTGTPLPQLLATRGITPGVKVDKGTEPLCNAPGDLVTRGLDDLKERLTGYRKLGARFAKWREVYPLTVTNPTRLGRQANAEMLARYAATCQNAGIVPIVEPEVLMDGDHEIGRCAEVTQQVLHAVFHALHRHRVTLEHMILKPNMVLPGKDCRQAPPEEVAEATLKVFRRCVPASVPGIYFLSGGQSPEEATVNLNAMNAGSPANPWLLSFSYGRALQHPVLEAWRGKPENIPAAQQALLKRARLNAAAQLGQYRSDMENDA